MTSTSRMVAALPLRDTTQIAPFGRIRVASSSSGARASVESAPRSTTSVSVSRPAFGHVRCPVCEQRAGSSRPRYRSTPRASPDGSRACRATAWCRPVPWPVSCHLMLLVYGPRSASYDFGPAHPLTPRRFGPGIDLLRAVGAEPGLAPEPASDEELLWCHTAAYLGLVRRFSRGSVRRSGRRDRHGWRRSAVRRDA